MSENSLEKPLLLVLAGPTAVGKTELSLRLAEALDGEIVSADSMQVYRGMDIGTAKAGPEEQTRVPHHLLDVADPTRHFSVAEYVSLARQALADIHARNRLPILCGGTGFYIQAVLKGLSFSEDSGPSAVRALLQKRMEEEGALALHRELSQADPEAAAAIHPHNRKRVIRALEYYLESGKKISELNRRQKEQEGPYRYLYLVLNLPREELYRRIDLRVEQMLKEGLVEEVRRLQARRVPEEATAMQGLGYKEVLDFLKGCATIEEASARIKTGSRHYAKRQITWFKREKEAIWLDKSLYEQGDALLQAALQLYKSFAKKDE